MALVLAWTMTCTHYWAAVHRLYQNEFFNRPENRVHREKIHRTYRSKTKPECLSRIAVNTEKSAR